MLITLHIENIAVIERADIEFGAGFNVLTGETGAGKSIVIDALDAVLGGRTSRELVRSGAEKASVTAQFSGDGAARWCEENGVDPDDDGLVLQRRIGPDGKSSCRVNGVPVSVSQLRELGALLLDIHGQNDGRQLMDEARHRDYLDSFGCLGNERSRYGEAYARYRATRREMDGLMLDEAERDRLTETLRYQIEELEAAELREGEEDELNARRALLRNAGKLTEAAEGAYEALSGGEYSAVGLSQEAEALLSRARGMSGALEKAVASVTEARYLLEDATETLRDFTASLDFSPDEYDRLESRLSLLRRLSKKYGRDEAGLIELLEESRRRLDDIEYAGDRLVKLEKELALRQGEAMSAARALSEARKSAAKALKERITGELRDLNMPSVRFEVEIAPLGGEPGFDAHGCDEIRFLMSANAGEAPGRISKIASGGELSRIMLAMKSVFAENDEVQAMVFDEIDTGVSGVAAQRVGEKMSRIALKKQVLCVTHLPQIAALADQHFVIEKQERGGRTFTSVTELDIPGRARELARLHGGDNVTETSLRAAGEQLNAAEAFKREAR